MTSKRLIDFIENPEMLDALSLKELEDVIKEFPYFQTARLLYLRNLSQLRSLRLSAELNRNVVYSTDRRKLFLLLDNNEYQWAGLMRRCEGKTSDTPAQPGFSLVESYLKHTDDSSLPSGLEDLIPHKQAPVGDYVSQLLDHPDMESSKELINHTQDDMITSFIRHDATRQKVVTAKEYVPLVPKPEKEESLIKDDSFLTESLAKIYIKQKKYAKALEIIKKLSLKYPEKNVYFADQIRFLEKIITNIKTE